MFKTGVGLSDFKEIIETNNFYADKTLFIKELIETNDKVVLITRPRRFGKTLNLSMIKYFFSNLHKEDEKLFYDLEIWKQDEKYKLEQGKYPIIYLTFKDNKENNFESALYKMKMDIAEIYNDSYFLFESNFLNESEKEEFKNIISKKASVEEYQKSIYKLCHYLSSFYHSKVILLLDEYDTPMQSAYLNKYWEQMSDFMRGLFGSMLKDNLYLHKAVITGITRIAKENLFSGVNNLQVSTIMDSFYADYFGLTEEEVFDALEKSGLGDKKQEVKEWYNGYTFGNNQSIYNPWSVLKFLKEGKLESFWANTSDNGLVKKYLKEMGSKGKMQIEDLLKRKKIVAKIDNQMVFSDLDIKGSVDRLWSLFLISGYLKTIQLVGKSRYEIAIPNKEIESIFEETVLEWFQDSSISNEYENFLKSLEDCDANMMEYFLSNIVLETFSYFDIGKKASENFYHAFFLGLLISLRDTYIIDSNRESGYGRYDVMLEPKDKTKTGFIIEFKAFNEAFHENIEQVANEALKQIEEKKYAVELKKRGIEKVFKMGIVFKGKEVRIVIS